MHKRSIILYCLFFLLIVAVDGVPRRKQHDNGRIGATSNQFDVLIFTQRWPQTVCYLWKENSASHACSLPKDDEWTIHGIWPSQYHKLGPQFCNHSLAFNATALKPIEKQLKLKWIDVEEGREPYSFWKHEWDKHGTCAAVLDNFNTEVKYFKEGLTLLDTYDMKHVLGKANILPGNQYLVEDIFGAIKKILGKTGEVMCARNWKTKEFYIFEIRICFDKTLQLIDCDGVYDYPTNCGHSESVMYPGDVPHDFHAIQI